MTLCAAWIREANDAEELVFATDSSLTGGEKWNQGIKLFELPRTDCLICFAGNTARAYPLILNLISSINLNRRLQSSRTDISEVLDYLATLFTSLVTNIIDDSGAAGRDIHELRAEAKFLFGGWSWSENRFRIWQLYYSKDAEGFIPNEYTNDPSKTRSYTFLGNPGNLADKASDDFKMMFLNDDRFDAKLDMEPLQVLIGRARDEGEREVDGSVQIAKVYKSGTAEFFGVYWPSRDGKPNFQGREFEKYARPGVRYFDPDTLELIEDTLPSFIPNLTAFEELDDFPFLRDCYDDSMKLKSSLSESQRERLISVFREVAYVRFVENMQVVEEEQP